MFPIVRRDDPPDEGDRRRSSSSTAAFQTGDAATPLPHSNASALLQQPSHHNFGIDDLQDDKYNEDGATRPQR